MTEPADGAGSRSPWTRTQVLRAAIDVADLSGIESLSMRRLSQELGGGTMSLYNHVSNKEDLLDGMIDVLFGEIDVPTGAPDWKTTMRLRALSIRTVMTRHPWAIGLMETRRAPGPASLRHHDTVIGCLRDAGFTIHAGRSRLLGPRQLHLRLRAPGTKSGVRHPRRNLRTRPGVPPAVPDQGIPASRRTDHRARPPARLQLRQRIRVRPRPHAGRPRKGLARGVIQRPTEATAQPSVSRAQQPRLD